MDKDLLNISKIESFFYELFYKHLSDNVFFTALPESIKSSWKDIVVVDIDITDNNVGKGIVNVFLYTKPFGDSRKNVSKLSLMEMKLNELIERSLDEHYHITRYKTYSDYDNSRNLYCSIVSLIIQII